MFISFLVMTKSHQEVKGNHDAVFGDSWLGIFTLSQSNLPATVAPGGPSVKPNDPFTTDTKNNNRQHNTTQNS